MSMNVMNACCKWKKLRAKLPDERKQRMPIMAINHFDFAPF